MRNIAGWLAVTMGLTLAHTLVNPLAYANGPGSVTLEGLEVVGTSDKLHILLKSHQLIPARVVSQRADEVVLELGNIDTRSPVSTRFSGQSLVSHVSMQALDDNRMRVVLRGESLPGADIAFKPVQAPPASALFQYEEPARPVKKTAARVKQADKLASAKAAGKIAAKPQPDKKLLPDDHSVDLLEAALPDAPKPKAYATAPRAAASKPIAPIVETLPPEAHIDAAATEAFNQASDQAYTQQTHPSQNNTPQNDPYEPLISAMNGDPAAEAKTPVAMQASAENTQITPAEAESKKAFDGLNWLQTIAPGLLGGLLMAIGGGALFWFFKRPTQPTADYGDYWDEAPPAEPPRRVKRQASRPDSLLGLSALQQPEPAYSAPRQSVNPSGIRHYQKADRNTGKLAAERLASMTRADYDTPRDTARDITRDASRDLTREEVRRSAGVKHRQVEAFQPPKAATGNSQRNGVRESLAQMQTGKTGLPPNPEVLDFLKSVADYMDKQPPSGR